MNSLKSLEVNQVLTKRSGDLCFIAEDSFEQFQIDFNDEIHEIKKT
jgi:hypothetical protein